AAVSTAWSARPLEERREALAKLLRGVTLSPGGVKVEYAYCHHAPPGPPYGYTEISSWALEEVVRVLGLGAVARRAMARA
ncbi:MAG: hypothetical protein ABIO70_10310, partial [Pseudomonadota bacterium]